MTSQPRSFWLTSKGFAALGLIAAASYFLLVEHRQHIAEWLPFLILALCPLMHVFMHHGHGRHSHAESPRYDDKAEAYRRGFEDGKNNSGQDHKELH